MLLFYILYCYFYAVHKAGFWVYVNTVHRIVCYCIYLCSMKTVTGCHHLYQLYSTMISRVRSSMTCPYLTNQSDWCCLTDVQCWWKQPTIHHETNSRYLHWTTTVDRQTFCSTLSSLISHQQHSSHLQFTTSYSKAAWWLLSTMLHMLYCHSLITLTLTCMWEFMRHLERSSRHCSKTSFSTCAIALQLQTKHVVKREQEGYSPPNSCLAHRPLPRVHMTRAWRGCRFRIVTRVHSVSAELRMDWIHPWIGLDWVGSQFWRTCVDWIGSEAQQISSATAKLHHCTFQ